MHLVYYSIQIPSCRIMGSRDFPGGPVGMTLCFHSWGTASIPGQGTKNLQGAAKKKKKNRIMETHFMINHSILQVITDNEII